VKPGQHFVLDAQVSSDPDGDSLGFYWFTYAEAGSCTGNVTIGAENRARIQLVAPTVERAATVHFIVKATDKGGPRLSRYRRVIVTVLP
jgi:hypothetical protein